LCALRHWPQMSWRTTLKMSAWRRHLRYD
jgi:hypothetical protein